MQRTPRQNRALHTFYRLLADTLNDAGLDQRTLLKPSVSIPWTPSAVKEQIWRPLQEALLAKKSTTELEKQKDIDLVYETIVRHLGEKFGVEVPEWPHFKSDEEFIKATL